MYERIDRKLSEAVWAETLAEMTPDELAEMVRRQDEERKEDYFEQAFKALWAADEHTILPGRAAC